MPSVAAVAFELRKSFIVTSDQGLRECCGVLKRLIFYRLGVGCWLVKDGVASTFLWRTYLVN